MISLNMSSIPCCRSSVLHQVRTTAYMHYAEVTAAMCARAHVYTCAGAQLCRCMMYACHSQVCFYPAMHVCVYARPRRIVHTIGTLSGDCQGEPLV